ncbi:hypothetical protein LCGC14_0968660 [marine sediment metagenome]|uniref:Uncharacterized protein n=1 Tax=marine sediment metagenome TaxID=412755 RepID=A0A0F9QVJ0_9ZZZZ
MAVVFGPPIPPFGGGGGSGRVFSYMGRKIIARRFGKDVYRLVAFSFFSDRVYDYADRRKAKTGKDVRVKRVFIASIDKDSDIYGVWEKTRHTAGKKKTGGKKRSAIGTIARTVLRRRK